jgi:hypothetical protein
MFEIDIRKEVFNGVMLHRKDGTPYWKLSLVCTRDGCNREVDMGECICFDTEKAMIECRDNHGLTCSTKCWYEISTREQIDKILKDIEKYNDECRATGEPEMVLKAETEIELIDDYLDAIADYYDGADFWESFDITECPV